MGGTCIYVLNNLNAVNINLDNFCNDKEMEAWAVSVDIASFKICILTIYRSPSSNYDTFLGKLELILHKLTKKRPKYLFVGISMLTIWKIVIRKLNWKIFLVRLT
jgi:hypothetical protein